MSSHKLTCGTNKALRIELPDPLDNASTTELSRPRRYMISKS